MVYMLWISYLKYKLFLWWGLEEVTVTGMNGRPVRTKKQVLFYISTFYYWRQQRNIQQKIGTRNTTYLERRINVFPSTSLKFQRYKGQNHLWTRIKRITNRTRYRVVIPDITWKHFVFNTTSFIIIANNQVFWKNGN